MGEPAQRIFWPGDDAQENVKAYNESATYYNQVLKKEQYNAPFLVVEEVVRMVPEEQRPSVKVLDVAAGTGWVGRELVKKGFSKLDALDPSEGMLKVLQELNIYGLKYQQFLGLGQNTVPKDEYDLVVVAGGMLQGHIPVNGLDDMIRIAKPGGLVIIAMRLEFLETVKAYRNKLEPHMEELENQAKWQTVARKIVPNYYGEKDGVIFTYRVL